MKAEVLRPVMDPSLPGEERALLAAYPGELVPAGDAPPAEARWGGRNGADVVLALLNATVCGFLPAVASFFFGRIVIVAGLLVQAGLVAAWLWGSFGLFLLIGTVIQLLAWPVVLVRAHGETPQRELARRHHGRYYLAGDFAGKPSSQMLRAQAAVTAVMESEVNAVGLLDDIANTVTLPQQEWEIAEALAELTRVRRKLVAVSGDAESSPKVKEMLEPQHRALNLSADALERRVRALESYAERTRAADEAYREWRAVQELADLSDDSRELLARTVRDELAIAEIAGLTEQARLVQEALRRSVEQAREAGLALPGAVLAESA